MLHVVRREPQQWGHRESRWRLVSLRASLPGWRVHSLAGLWQLLERLGIHYKRARDYVHSPDPHYAAKLAQIAECLERARAEPERLVLLYGDEATYYRQPSLARGYEAQGPEQPLAQRSYRSNARMRILATLNALSAQVTFQQQRVAGLQAWPPFWQAVRSAYPQAQTIYVVLDHWPMHFHPDVLAALQPQQFSWPLRKPANWPTEPSTQALHLNLPIQLLSLPSYASWCNPIEKLWRWLRQNVLHLHRLADDWPALQQHVADALSTFSSGSPDLLRYVGLSPQPT